VFLNTLIIISESEYSQILNKSEHSKILEEKSVYQMHNIENQLLRLEKK